MAKKNHYVNNADLLKSIEAYQKDGAHILVGFTSNFKHKAENEPDQCPCDVSLFLFSNRVR